MMSLESSDIMLKNWSVKKRVFAIAFAVIVLALIAGLLYFMFKPDAPPKVILTTVFSGDVTQTLDATGTVESANQDVFPILDGTKVLTVNFRVGDKIKKGDLLATFDTSSLSNLINDKQKAYNTAYETYSNAKNAAKSSSEDLVQLETDIKATEAEISDLEAKIASSSDSGTVSESSQSILDKITAMFGDSILINLLKGNGNTGFDLSSITGMSADQTKLTSLQLELLQLKAKQTIAKAQASGTLESTLKSFYESSLEDLNATKAAVENLKTGWIAKEDGIVREVKIANGQIYKNVSAIDTNLDLSSIINLLSSNSGSADIMSIVKQYLTPNAAGMTVEYYPFAASFVLGKYDVLKVTMDQEAKITAPNGSVFTGKITYISPVASTSSSINISSILGTSGSSSGVEAKVSIPNPDSGVIIGFDVDISIDVDKAENAILVPAEAIQFDSEGSYVFLYNSKTKRVTRNQVKTGIFSGSLYQILSGCEVGDVIIKAPPMTLVDGDKVSIETTESPASTTGAATTVKS